jgi:hypothetical protein
MKKLACVCAAVLPLALPVMGTNLLYNGGFELGGFTNAISYVTSTNNDIPGWTVQGTASRNVALHKSPEVGQALGPEFNYAQDGSNYLDLSGNGTNHPTVVQGFPTWQGFGYVLSFWLGAASQTPAATINVQIFDERTNLNVTLTPAPTANGNISWTRFEFNWIAHANNSLLRFRDLSNTDDNASFIDNVRVEPYPSQLPPFRVLSLRYGSQGLGSPFGWVITWESLPSFTYQVLYKNSLSDATWTPLGPPFVPPASPDPAKVSFTDTTAPPTAQRFYQVMGQ